MYDFIRAELEAHVPAAPDHPRPLVRDLARQRYDPLAFAAERTAAFTPRAAPLVLDPAVIRELFAAGTLPVEDRRRWLRDAALRRTLGRHNHPLAQAVEALRRGTVRARSLAENPNSRRRGYVFLRRHLGNDYSSLLQFFLNHRLCPRRERPDRVNKSSAEVLTGNPHPHWPECLGFTRFSRN